jgi:NAD-dependent deacetylase
MKNIVVLTGAGISAESGVPTFRASDGLWCNHRIEDVATPEGFGRNPELVHRFYNQRRLQLQEVHPNAAHHALAKLAVNWNGGFQLITQNVDDLHERAWENEKTSSGFSFIHMHGELKKVRCVESGKVFYWEDDLTEHVPCACCKEPGNLRPHIVWFGEMPLSMDVIHDALDECDLFLSIGTSGNVYPAAGFVQQAQRNGRCRTVELNLEPSSGHSLFDEAIYGPATKVVPPFIDRLLSQSLA